ncbi:MAG: alpha/beta hydrolase [Flavobacteriales bacterium]|nr:alpha/beta hydrolase [Flavobacteriales bacterium]
MSSSTSNEVYIFSGLGADERVFCNIDFKDKKPHYIQWILPEKEDTLETYATRLIEQIKTPSPHLIGLSFGGMMAIEVSKQIEVQSVTIISSVKTKKELPLSFKIMGSTGLYKLIPVWVFKQTNFLMYWLFGVSDKEEVKLIRNIIKETNSVYLKWAIHEILNWKHTDVHESIKHIHGTKDRVLPIHNIRNQVHKVSGGHMIVLNKPKEVSDIIHEFMKSSEI